jgi:hypothetical protein
MSSSLKMPARRGGALRPRNSRGLIYPDEMRRSESTEVFAGKGDPRPRVSDGFSASQRRRIAQLNARAQFNAPQPLLF